MMYFYFIFIVDFVLLKDDFISRVFWKLVKVEEFIFGRDCNVWVVVVKVVNNLGCLFYLRRVV